RLKKPKVFDANNKYVEPIIELKALQYGIKSVARFAAIGTLDNDKIGCKLYKSESGLNQMINLMRNINGIQYESGFFGFYKNQMVCMVPTFFCENPILTVGFGDTIIANIFLKQLQYRKSIKATL
ncbi:MAG: hypothetical protein LRZ92_05090, partial [Methanosarcinaceae archaeon]|nr:hypothetical protein [Methanosarcinaceae archaeon]